VIEVNDRETGVDEMTQDMPFIPEELETSEAFRGHEPDPDRTTPEIPWNDPDFIDCHTGGFAPAIGQEPNGRVADLVVADDDDGESRFPYFWEIGPDFPPTPEITALSVAEPELLENRPNESETKLENFTNLTDLDDALGIIEAQHIETPFEGRGAVWKARAAVILAIKHAFLSRFNLGKALSSYRAFFKAERGWMEAANIIACGLRRCEKTVRNAISDYEQLSAALPAKVIEVAELRGIDLARQKFQPTVKSIEGTINSNDVVSEDQAAQIVDSIIACKTANRTAKSPKPVPSIEDFADRTAISFEKLLNGASSEVREAEVQYVLEYVNARLRTSIRELRQYGRPTLVPKPATRMEEIA
jgi:hypothetical protein